jgi:hypothetical protein
LAHFDLLAISLLLSCLVTWDIDRKRIELLDFEKEGRAEQLRVTFQKERENILGSVVSTKAVRVSML